MLEPRAIFSAFRLHICCLSSVFSCFIIKLCRALLYKFAEKYLHNECKSFCNYFHKSCRCPVINRFLIFLSSFIKITGQSKTAEIPKEWLDMSNGCVNEVRRQIQAEIDASMVYLTMGAHFAQDTINRPGFSEFFFKAAGEEREHAHKLIEYLLMRGSLEEVTDLIKVNVSDH